MIQEKVALITGAGSGIGKATAVALAQHGIHIAALSRTSKQIEQTVQEINQKNDNQAISLVADIQNEEEIKSAIQQVIKQWGRLDIIFANAGINGVWAPVEDLSAEEWQHTLNINLTGTFLTIKYAVPFLKKQGGNIIITSSINGTRIFSNTGATAYSVTKAGQVAMAKMLAVELASSNIRVNVICPGATDTEIDQNTERRNLDKVQFPVEYPEGSIPLGNDPAESEDVAHLVCFLVSDEARMITGTEVWIDGASSLVRG